MARAAAKKPPEEEVKPQPRKPVRRHHAEPRCKEVMVSVSAGGSVGLLDFGKLKSDFNVSERRVYDVPEGWTEDQIDGFRTERYIALREDVDARAQIEFEDLMDQSALFEKGSDGNYKYVGS